MKSEISSDRKIVQNLLARNADASEAAREAAHEADSAARSRDKSISSFKGGFGGHRPQSSASTPSGRGEASSTQSLQSKLQLAFSKPANRGILEATVTVERIQKLRGRVKVPV